MTAQPSTKRPRFSLVRLGRLIIKEAKQLVRDPKARPIIFVSPIMQLLVFGYAATTDVKNIKTVVVDQDRTAESRALVSAYETSGYFTVVAYGSGPAEIASALSTGRSKVGLTIPAGFARELRSGRGAVIQAVIDGSDASMATVAQSYAGQVAGAYGARVASERQMPRGVELRSRAWFNPSLESRFFNVPAIMGVLMLMICLLLTALNVVRERETGTLDQLLVSPIKPMELMIGKTVPVLLLGLLHLSIYVCMALFLFEVPLQGALLTLFLAALLYIATGLALGLLISTVSRTQQEAFMLVILFLLPAVMLSGFLSPIDGIPEGIRWLTLANPLRYFMEILRGVFLKGSGLQELWVHFVVLAGMALTTLAIATRRFRSFAA